MIVHNLGSKTRKQRFTEVIKKTRQIKPNGKSKAEN